MSAIDKLGKMKWIFIVAMITVLAPASAHAQDKKGPPTDRSDSEKRKDAEIDKAYRDTLKRNSVTPAAKADPWQTIRPANTDTTKQR